MFPWVSAIDHSQGQDAGVDGPFDLTQHARCYMLKKKSCCLFDECIQSCIILVNLKISRPDNMGIMKRHFLNDSSSS